MKRPTYIAHCYFCWWFRQRKHAVAFHRLLALSKGNIFRSILTNQSNKKLTPVLLSMEPLFHYSVVNIVARF